MRQIALLFASLGLSLAAVAAEPQTASRPDNLNVAATASCKPSGDGTFAEIVTTMASVLPQAEGDALLARYCSDCMKRKLLVGQLPAGMRN